MIDSRIMVVLIIGFLFFIPLANAIDMLVISDTEKNPEKIQIKIVDYNEFYRGDYIISDINLESHIAVFDNEDNLLFKMPQAIGSTILPYFPNAARIAVFETSELQDQITSRSVSFCNDNGVCEPCKTPSCTSYENHLTCADCASGSDDGFCDMELDGICDPDCDNIEYDCENCKPFCGYKGATCESLNGSICLQEQACAGGYFTQGLLDQGLLLENCCVGGVCADADQLADLSENASELSQEDKYEQENEYVGSRQPDREIDYFQLAEQRKKESDVSYVIMVVGFILMVFLILFLIIVWASKKAKKLKKYNLQSEIGLLAKKGYNYNIIKTELINRGYQKDFVDSELKKYYGR